MNSFLPIDPTWIDKPSPEIAQTRDGHPGYTKQLKAADTPDALKEACGNASREFPNALWLEPKDWPDKARDNDKYQTWPMNWIDRYTMQSPTHECTCHMLRACFEGAWNRARGVSYPDGPKKNFRYEESAKFGSVWVSSLSIYAEANPGKWGGAGCRQVLEIACRRGFLPDKTQPRDYGFKHYLQGTNGDGNSNQSSGSWVSVDDFPDGWRETAKLLKPKEVIFTDSWEQVVCLILHGYLVGVGRDGHAIPYSRWHPTDQIMAYLDSYNVTRYDSLRTLKYASEGAFAIASVTIPDDWMKPAGIDSNLHVAV